jgi:hypothetical protein
MRSYLATLSCAALLSLGSNGCIQKVLVDGQIASTREGAGAFDTIGDVELGRVAAEGSFGMAEGLHALAPYNINALFMLTKSWTGYGVGFILDKVEAAEDAGDDAAEEYQRKRAKMAFDRAIFYGLQILGQRSEGFDQAKKNAATLDRWLSDHFKQKDDAAALIWTGLAWLQRVDVMKGDDNEGPVLLAELYVGASMIERAAALDPSAEHYTGLVVLGGYHARLAFAELDQAKQIFDRVLGETQGKNLTAPVTYATTYACMKGDGALYQDLLNRVIVAQDPDPSQRLANAIAKRRAKRWLSKKRAKNSCGIDVNAPAPSASR